MELLNYVREQKKKEKLGAKFKKKKKNMGNPLRKSL